MRRIVFFRPAQPKNPALSSIEFHPKNSAAAKVGGCRAALSQLSVRID
jgi:hypothetical protein